jgi:EpsI family protein
MSLEKRVFLVAFLVVTIQAGTTWVRQNYVPSQVRLPSRNLNALPIQLGELGAWHGENAELDPEVFNAIGAHSVLERRYRDGLQEVLVHSAVILDATSSVAHYPEVCYPANGWQIVSRKSVLLRVSGAPAVSARLLNLEREDQRIQVLFWYHLGEHSFVDRDSYRHARRAFWGEKTWPAVIKVMLQTSADDAQRGESQLREFGKLVLAETSKML